MARIFYDGIVAANDSITPPETPSGGISDSLPDVVDQASTTYEKVPVNTIRPIQTQQG